MEHKKMQQSNKTKSLPEVFRELQQSKMGQPIPPTIKPQKVSRRKTKQRAYPSLQKLGQVFLKFSYFRLNRKQVLKVSAITGSIFVLVLAMISTNYILATNEQNENEITINQFEENKNAIVLENIIAENINIVKMKQTSTEIRDIDFEVVNKESAALPKGEQVIVQEGIKGKEEVEVIRTYENEKVVDEKITKSTRLEDPKQKIVEMGTSEFLAKHKVHIGDTMFVKEDTSFKNGPASTDTEITKIKKYLNVKLLEVTEQWCKVSYEDKQGYVNSNSLISEMSMPGVTEKNRVQKLQTSLDFNMAINKPSGLTLKDFKKVLSGNPQDKNGILQTNAEVFYGIEQKYKINGVFVASLAIHESAWGTSTIAMEKKNLFGYGSYDRDPYNSSYQFEEYKDGIELVSKVFVKYYLNVTGTKIYDNEVAQGKYYNGPTISGVNTRYASDENWAEKVYQHMQYLYNRL